MFIGQVGLESVSPAPKGLGQRDELLRSFFANIIVNRDIASGPEQAFGDGLADSLLGARDEGALPDK
jgi:hypothetical protein